MYGDRHGNGVGNNGYRTYNADGTTDPATSFTYWTDPIDDTASTPNATHDTNPNMVYSPVPPTTVTPAPWVPYTRAGCNVGEIATANQELENPTFDIPQFFGANSPEVAQLNADSDSFKDQETAELRRHRRALRQGQLLLCERASSEVRADHAVQHRLPTCCRTSPAATAASRRCSGISMSRRSSALALRT